MKKVAGLLFSFLISFPIRVYLMWYILKSINATELPMFLFYVSIPLGLLVMILSEMIKSDKKND